MVIKVLLVSHRCDPPESSREVSVRFFRLLTFETTTQSDLAKGTAGKSEQPFEVTGARATSPKVRGNTWIAKLRMPVVQRQFDVHVDELKSLVASSVLRIRLEKPCQPWPVVHACLESL
jgi:hypothetical protein